MSLFILKNHSCIFDCVFHYGHLSMCYPFNLWSSLLSDWVRDLADASLIGTKGLRGNSWPDLDMLPFGLLTDPGKWTSFII